jgi:selenocysteine lyase/cysteine desulfurase
MLAIKANYQNGIITLLDAMPEKVKKARLTIVVEPDEHDSNLIPAQEFKGGTITSEAEFEAIGLSAFFEEEDDKNVNWEDYFGIK